MDKEVLCIDKVNLNIAERVILSHLSMRILRQEIHVLMGPNGSGKSSLAKAIAGHPNYKIQSGHMLFAGQSIDAMPPEKRSQLGIFMAFQAPCEVEGVSVVNFLRTAIHAHTHLPASRYSATQFYEYLYTLLDQVNLPRDFTRRSLNQGFSGGEKKRFEMLQLLLFQPKFVILDEIDSGLDVDALKIVVHVLHHLQTNCQTSFLVITHSIPFIEQIQPTCVHLLRDGQIVRSGRLELLDQIKQSGFNDL